MQATILRYQRWYLVLVSAFFLTACGSGSGSGSSTDPVNSAPPPPAATPEISGVSPQSLAFELRSGEMGSATLSFTNSGDAALAYELSAPGPWFEFAGSVSGTLAADSSTSLSVNVSCGSADLSGDVMLSSNDADEGSLSIPVRATCMPIATNLAVERVLMNQGARAFDSNESDTPSVEVVAGREMVVRAFVTGSGPSPEAQVIVSRPGQADFIMAMQVPPSISDQQATETNLQASHYAVLPGSAIETDSSVRIEVAPFDGTAAYPVNGDIPLNASAYSPFEVTFVPVTFEGQTPSLRESTYIRDALKVLPIGEVDVEIREPYTYTGTFDLEDILMEISDLRGLDGSDRLYHAIVVPPPGTGAATAGVAFVGYPVSVSLDLGGTGYVIAHEMGHNLNLGHAPGCDAPNADPDYPYADGAVETWGYDIVEDRLVEPTDTTRDFMSYCNDLWVSDYHFNRAIEHRAQSSIGFGPTVSQGLTVSGRMQHGVISHVRMVPAENVQMQFSGPSTSMDYSFVAWDQTGRELAHSAFTMQTIEDASGAAGFVFTIPAVGENIYHYELRRNDAVIYSHTNASQLPAPISVEWAWQDSTALVSWNRQSAEQALIVRDTQGQVIAVDRSGSFSMQTSSVQAAGISLALVSEGVVGVPVTLESVGHQRLSLTP